MSAGAVIKKKNYEDQIGIYANAQTKVSGIPNQKPKSPACATQTHVQGQGLKISATARDIITRTSMHTGTKNICTLEKEVPPY